MSLRININGLFPIIPSSIPGSGGPGDGLKEKVENVKKGYIELYGKTLPGGLIILKSPDNEAVSEGIGFAGIILAQSDDAKSRQEYLQLYLARKSYFLKENGVMAWKIDVDGNKIGNDSASDADQDWIASELMALEKIKSGKWALPAGATIEGFKQEIQKDLDAFWEAHVKSENGRLLFLATDGSWAQRGDGRDIYYTSYADPHFLKMFAEFDSDNQHDWTKLSKDVLDLDKEICKNYTTLGAAGLNPIPAKVFVSVASGGTYTVENYYTISKQEGVTGDDIKDNEMDAIVIILRMSRAAILDNNADAISVLNSILTAANITTPSSAYILAGSTGAPSKWGWNNTVARTSYGLAVYAADGSVKADPFITTVENDYKVKYFGEWDGAKAYYHDQSLILQMLDLVK